MSMIKEFKTPELEKRRKTAMIFLPPLLLKENESMIELEKKLGVEIKRDPEAGDDERVIDFKGNSPC